MSEGPEGNLHDDADPNELYGVPEEEQLTEDPGHDPEHTGGDPDDLSEAPEGDENVIVWFGDDDLDVVGDDSEDGSEEE